MGTYYTGGLFEGQIFLVVGTVTSNKIADCFFFLISIKQ